MRILVIEDDPSVRTLVKAVLEHNGNTVLTAETAETGKELGISEELGMVILDLGLPDGNGYEVCEYLRKNDVTTPVLILSAEKDTDVKVKCLKVGADDYITKPFNTEELLARIQAVHRRADGSKNNQTLLCNEIKVDQIKRLCWVNDVQVNLTNNEFNLLVYFIKNKDKTVSQEELAENVWNIHFDTQTNYINVYISYLRKKLNEVSSFDYIETVRKKGFVFRCS